MTTTTEGQEKLSLLFKEHHTRLFEEHGATPLGVDWKDENELLFRYQKMLAVLNKDFYSDVRPSLLDVGCGWGGLLRVATERSIDLDYTGIDLAENMISYCQATYPLAKFATQDVLALDDREQYDFVVSNGALTQKLTASNSEMEAFMKRFVRKMFALARHGIAFNLMSNQVNFMAQNLFYNSPLEIFAFCLGELSPRVRIDHGYSSLVNGRGKYYDFTIYVYKD